MKEAPAIRDAKEYQTVVLAALLHDVGKFLQRGRSLSIDVEGKHPEVSARFISAFSDVFAPLCDVEILKDIVLHHHRDPRLAGLRVEDITDPHTRLLAALINKADGLSASERRDRSPQWQDFKTVPLVSIFANVYPRENTTLLRHHAVALTEPCAMSKEGLFPADFAGYQVGELEAALTSFGSHANQLLRNLAPDFNVVLAHLLSLLAVYTWSIPSDTQELQPDVSLYDHLRTTAAIASCLYQVYEAKGMWDRIASGILPGNPFCLVVGDVSGIQDYIFTITGGAEGGGMAKRLRARSLFVQLISEAVPLQILQTLGLSQTNILMNSGGKFYLLLPNLETTVETLATIQVELDRWFLRELRGALRLNLAWTAFAESGFREFGTVLSKAIDRLGERKEQQFSQVLVADGKWQSPDFLFPPFGANQRACPSCGKFPAAKDEGRVCDYCVKDREWGKHLVKTHYILLFEQPGRNHREINGTGLALVPNLEGLSDIPNSLLKINDPDTRSASNVPTAFRYLVKHVPATIEGDLLEFKEIAAKSTGRPYLAFLKADVDSLGEVMAFGLKGRNTVSRLATFSRQLDLFFTGWVHHLLETEFPYCYAVFSGGDDLFLVGPWDNILRLAMRLRADFADYTCHNPHLTFSAGMVIAPHSYPIGQAAHEVEMALDASKIPPKDKITLLGHTLAWRDLATIYDIWEELKGEGASSAFLYSLLEYAEMWRDYLGGNVLGLRFQPLLSYNVSRNLDPKRNPKLYRWAQGLVDFRPGDKSTRLILDNLGLIAQLLILSKQGGKDERISAAPSGR